MTSRLLRAGKTFWTLSPGQRSVLMEAMIVVPTSALWLRVRGSQRTLASVGSYISPRQDLRLSPQECARLLAIACRRLFPWTRCLVRSVALARLLRRRGIGAEICLGARKEGERLDAHAWVEVDHVVVSDPEEVAARYTPFGPTRVTASSRES